MSWLEDGYKNIWLPYTQMKHKCSPLLEVVDAKDCTIFTADGEKLIDGTSSWWSACHGYKNKYIVEKIQKQAEQLAHIMLGSCAHEQAYKLAHRLPRILPHGLEKIFFCDSGSVGVEVAMKIAVQYFKNKGTYLENGKNTKTSFISFANGYHGDTMACMSVSDPHEGYHGPVYGEYIPVQHCLKIPRNDEEFIEFETSVKSIKDKVAAIIIEPLLQCAGGMILHSVETLRKIYKLAKKYDILFIADEMATSFGRLGHMFACTEANITPDIMVFGKALTGGTCSLTVTSTTDEIFNEFLSEDLEKALIHGTTYMGNPIACAAANASLDLFEQEPRLEQVSNIEKLLKNNTEINACKALPNVKSVSIKGAMVSITLKEAPTWKNIIKLREKAIEKGVFIRPFSNVIYIMPPFIITENELGTHKCASPFST